MRCTLRGLVVAMAPITGACALVLGIEDREVPPSNDRDSGAPTVLVDGAPAVPEDGEPAVFMDAGKIRDASAEGGVVWPENGHTYAFVERRSTWGQANAEAIAGGGYLATLPTAAEHAFVAALANGRAGWLGGVRADVVDGPARGWSWVKRDEVWSFTAWSPGQPNNTGSPTRLAMREDGKWNDGKDLPAELLGGFIVEIDPPK